MSIAFVDPDHLRESLLPFTYTRPICELRLGILTIREKWEHLLGETGGFITASYLQEKFPRPAEPVEFMVNGALLPEEDLVREITGLDAGSGLYKDDIFLAARMNSTDLSLKDLKHINWDHDIRIIRKKWDIFLQNGDEIRADYDQLTQGRKTAPVNDSHTIVYGNNLFVEEGVSIKAAIINTEEGPVYLGRNSKIHEGAIIKGPVAIGNDAHVNLGAKIRPNTTIGQYSKVGGEVSNSIIQGFSNKSHDGFLGNSVIGEWCNLGADSNTSNLKNNYSRVKVWNFAEMAFEDSGLQFCGLFMGDFSKCGINTMFNSGTTVGISCSVFGPGFQDKLIPSFSWGGKDTTETYDLEKAIASASVAFERRHLALSEADKRILGHVYSASSKFRTGRN